MGSRVGHTLVQTLTPTDLQVFPRETGHGGPACCVFVNTILLKHSPAHSLHFAHHRYIFSMADCAL